MRFNCACNRRMSATTLRDAKNSEHEHNSISTGIVYIAERSPAARNGASISVAPAACIAWWAKKSLNAPMTVAPKLAPSTYIAKK